jgi:hypothetical protein
MCIMEIHEGQHSTTLVQAMAHNASTQDRDLDMLIKVLVARGEREHATMVIGAQRHIHAAYALLLGEYGDMVAESVQDGAGHVHTHDHGGERSLVEVAHHDAGLARRFETR